MARERQRRFARKAAQIGRTLLQGLLRGDGSNSRSRRERGKLLQSEGGVSSGGAGDLAANRFQGELGHAQAERSVRCRMAEKNEIFFQTGLKTEEFSAAPLDGANDAADFFNVEARAVCSSRSCCCAH